MGSVRERATVGDSSMREHWRAPGAVVARRQTLPARARRPGHRALEVQKLVARLVARGRSGVTVAVVDAEVEPDLGPGFGHGLARRQEVGPGHEELERVSIGVLLD